MFRKDDDQPSDSHEKDVRKAILFTVDAEKYAVGLETVREVLEYVEPKPIPKAVPACEGIINLRGEVVSVLDLAKLWNIVVAPGARRAFIVIDCPMGPLAILVSAIVGVVDITDSPLEPVPTVLTSIPAHCFDGVLRHKDAMVMLVDLGRTAMSAAS